MRLDQLIVSAAIFELSLSGLGIDLIGIFRSQ
jgi:hypothetical protein